MANFVVGGWMSEWPIFIIGWNDFAFFRIFLENCVSIYQPTLMDKRKILNDATEWFLDTFRDITTYETAYNYAEWTLYACPFIKTEEHFLFASKLAIMMVMADDSFDEQEFIVFYNYLKTSVVNEPSTFVSAIIKLFADFKKVAVHEENYNYMVETAVAFIESSKGKKSNDVMDCILDTSMIPFYIISLDSNEILADMSNDKMFEGAYGTRIDNDLLSYPKDSISNYMTDHSNPLHAGRSIEDQISIVKNHYTVQLTQLAPSLEDAICLQGRIGSLLWSLFTKRYGCILKTVYEDNQTVANIRNSIQKNVNISDKKHYYL
ncbi:uncharacterized protein BX664DRAFT_385069 [Halteromyces radiatus]|uniref:uncharacterized protein n=1 Tax=Halteromyces radiatus TaxID=101107 RepID=UPI00221E9581|nr:uncharacterized protein BX664DRAFT_385069 [Halteromyces radiatus]KAI8093681.1 hypothetical protein BX664DRAFT_385069 [Halteromyces radiatus]